MNKSWLAGIIFIITAFHVMALQENTGQPQPLKRCPRYFFIRSGNTLILRQDIGPHMRRITIIQRKGKGHAKKKKIRKKETTS